VIASHQGNWMASNLSHLGGYFAGILQLEVSEEHVFALTTELERMSDLDIKIQQGLESVIHPDKQLQFVITGNDRPGIVRELSSVMKHKGANIIHFESSKQSAPNWGVPLFHAIATVELPAGLNKDEVVKALEAIASDVVVDIEH
jgi:glycine cleavage system regulatory protein